MILTFSPSKGFKCFFLRGFFKGRWTGRGHKEKNIPEVPSQIELQIKWARTWLVVTLLWTHCSFATYSLLRTAPGFCYAHHGAAYFTEIYRDLLKMVPGLDVAYLYFTEIYWGLCYAHHGIAYLWFTEIYWGWFWAIVVVTTLDIYILMKFAEDGSRSVLCLWYLQSTKIYWRWFPDFTRHIYYILLRFTEIYWGQFQVSFMVLISTTSWVDHAHSEVRTQLSFSDVVLSLSYACGLSEYHYHLPARPDRDREVRYFVH